VVSQSCANNGPMPIGEIHGACPHMYTRSLRYYLPDIRDGLTQRERIVLQCLHALQQERGGRDVPTGMLYGSVVEHVDMTVEEMQSILVRLIGHPLRS